MSGLKTPRPKFLAQNSFAKRFTNAGRRLFRRLHTESSDKSEHSKRGTLAWDGVYEAIQLSLGRRVALKVLPFASGLDAVRLQRIRHVYDVSPQATFASRPVTQQVFPI